MLFRRPSSLPISARVVAVKPLRAKHLAAAERIDATRGFSQSAERCCGFSPFSSAGLRTIGVLKTVSVVVVMFLDVPASRYRALLESGDSQGGRSAPSPRPASSPTSRRQSSLASPRSVFRLFLLGLRGLSAARVVGARAVLGLWPAFPE